MYQSQLFHGSQIQDENLSPLIIVKTRHCGILTAADEIGYTKYIRKIGNLEKEKHQVAIIQWVSEEDEHDIYYCNIRLGIEKRLRNSTMRFYDIFNDIPLTWLRKRSNLYRKFSKSQISDFEAIGETPVFVDSDT